MWCIYSGTLVPTHHTNLLDPPVYQGTQSNTPEDCDELDIWQADSTCLEVDTKGTYSVGAQNNAASVATSYRLDRSRFEPL
jgi:hypothetical protein